MASQTPPGPSGWQRTFSHGELTQIVFQLTASTESCVQLEDEVVAYRLDGVG